MSTSFLSWIYPESKKTQSLKEYRDHQTTSKYSNPLVFGQVLYVKTSFRGFETEQIPGFQKTYTKMVKIYHELTRYMYQQDSLKFINFIYNEYKVKM